MTDPFVGEIRMFGGNFAPRSWAKCDGQLLAVSQNDALFALLGTTYGGDGRTTFGLPDLRGRVPIHQGTGPGLSQRRLGSKAGQENVTIQPNQMAAHTHAFNASTDLADATSPSGRVLATSSGGNLYGGGTAAALDPQAIVGTTGGGGSHPNVMPFQCVCFIIALFGIFPSRN